MAKNYTSQICWALCASTGMSMLSSRPVAWNVWICRIALPRLKCNYAKCVLVIQDFSDQVFLIHHKNLVLLNDLGKR